MLEKQYAVKPVKTESIYNGSLLNKKILQFHQTEYHTITPAKMETCLKWNLTLVPCSSVLASFIILIQYKRYLNK